MADKKTREPSQPLSELPLIEQIDAVIAANGSVPQPTKDTLMFAVVKTLVVSIDRLQVSIDLLVASAADKDERLKVLEGRNIVTWCIKHPTPAITISVLFVLLLFSHYGTTVLNLLGIKVPVIP